MCLLIDRDEHVRSKKGYFVAKQAKKDIKVYKVILKNNDGLYNTLNIDGLGETWKKGFIYEETKFPKKRGVQTCDINGFHSFMRKKECNRLREICYAKRENTKIVEMYIPKGAWYFVGQNRDYFSSHLKYVKYV